MALSDNNYKDTKQIMLGKAAMNADFQPLADWINVTYGITTVNILYDVIENGKLPELTICLELEKEVALFLNKNNIDYTKAEQKKIAKAFKDTLEQQGLMPKQQLLGFLFGPKYQTDNIWVTFTSFERAAKIEAVNNIPSTAIDAFKQQHSAEGLWEISRFFGYTTFFLHTRQQVKELDSSDTRKVWTDEYFALLKQYDEFHYFRREAFDLIFDSKETFMDTYQGNWYYYYK